MNQRFVLCLLLFNLGWATHYLLSTLMIPRAAPPKADAYSQWLAAQPWTDFDEAFATFPWRRDEVSEAMNFGEQVSYWMYENGVGSAVLPGSDLSVHNFFLMPELRK